MADSVLPTDLYEIEGLRNNLISDFAIQLPEITQLQEDIKSSDKLIDTFNSLNIDDKLKGLDVIVFLSIDAYAQNDSHLFGEISQVIEAAIIDEVNELSNVQAENFSRHATPDIVSDVSDNKLKLIVSDLLQEGTDNSNDISFAIRYMQLYNESATTSEKISDTSSHKIEQNSEFLYFLGAKMLPAQSEGHIGDIMNYTVAVVSNIRDGTVPDISEFKEHVSEAINNGINTLVNSEHVKESITTFKDLNEMFSDCNRILSNIEDTENFRDAIEVMKEVCEKQLEKVNNDVFEL